MPHDVAIPPHHPEPQDHSHRQKQHHSMIAVPFVKVCDNQIATEIVQF